eukprot:6875771-Alexandrium_andersonii.AAC.1
MQEGPPQILLGQWGQTGHSQRLRLCRSESCAMAQGHEAQARCWVRRASANLLGSGAASECWRPEAFDS